MSIRNKEKEFDENAVESFEEFIDIYNIDEYEDEDGNPKELDFN